MLGGLGSESSLTNERMGMGRVPGLEPWKIETKWNGTPSTRKNYTEKVEGTLKRFPEMMATWQSKLTEGYTVENFAFLTHEFAKGRSKQRMRDASRSCWGHETFWPETLHG